ncbi:MAG: glycosyltransferase family 4 protein [Parcubacteria group bacterium]|nr:glycosyltransferase family 4 protein [Parcubacteria group bacterium]
MPNRKHPLLLTLEYPPSLPQTIPQESLGAPKYGGVATYLAGEVGASRELVRVMRAEEHFWDKWPHWLPLLWRAIPPPVSRRGLGGGRPDYLWISHILPIGYAALWWKWRFKIPYRVYVHGLDLVMARRSAWKRWWASRILREASEIIANSRATSQLLLKYGIDPSRARVSYPRVPKVDPARYRAHAAELRQKYALGARPILLSVGRLVKRKGIDVVLRSLREVWKIVPELVYVVVGDGTERRELELSSRGGHVMFTGEVSDEEKYAWLSACDCFILTPTDDPNDFEGYGIVYKEAQMFNKPVIGSRVGGVPEAVGDNGVLVEPGNIGQIAEAIITQIENGYQKTEI